MKAAFPIGSAFLLCLACGGSPPPAEAPTGGGHPEPEAAGHAGHAELTGPLKDFHEVLTPLWHAEKGPKRADATCEKAKDLEAKAEATKDAELVSATKALSEACAKEGRPEFEERLVAVHERFHALAK